LKGKKGKTSYRERKAVNKKINYRHRLTQIDRDKMKGAMPLKIVPPTSPTNKRKNPCKSVS